MLARRISLLLILLAAAVAGSTAAYAGGDGKPSRRAPPGKDYVAELKPAELKLLKARIKDWDRLDAHKKQRMARTVVWMRTLDKEQRKQFEERMRRMRGKSKDWQRMRKHGGRMLVDRGLAHAALRKLGRDFERRLRRSDISAHVFERSFANAFWSKVGAAAFVDGEPPAPDALAAKGLARSPMFEKYSSLHAQYRAASDDHQRKMQRKRLVYALSFLSAHALRHELARSDVKGTGAYLAAVGRKVQQTWPGPFAETLEDPDALLRAAENHEVRRSLARLMRRDGKLLREESALLVKLVERWVAGRKRRDADAAAADADALIQRILREDFSVSPDVLDAMPPRSEMQKRAAWYLQLLRRHLGQRFAMRAGGGSPRKDARARALRKPLARPAGVSEADWKAYTQAVSAAGGRPFFHSAPDGVSEEGWKRIRAALKKRMEGFGRRRGG